MDMYSCFTPSRVRSSQADQTGGADVLNYASTRKSSQAFHLGQAVSTWPRC